MTLRLQIDPGGEKYFSFAQKKLAALKQWMVRANLGSMTKHFKLSDSESIWIKSVNVGHGVFLDFIRITAGGGGFDFYFRNQDWQSGVYGEISSYVLGNVAPTTIRTPASDVGPVNGSLVLKTHETAWIASRYLRYPLLESGLPDLTAAAQSTYYSNAQESFSAYVHPQLGVDYVGILYRIHGVPRLESSANELSQAILVHKDSSLVDRSLLFTDDVLSGDPATPRGLEVTDLYTEIRPPVATSTTHFLATSLQDTTSNVVVRSLALGVIIDHPVVSPAYVTPGAVYIKANLTDVCTAFRVRDDGISRNIIYIYINGTLMDSYETEADALDKTHLPGSYDGGIIGVEAFDGGFAVATDGLGSFSGDSIRGVGYDTGEDRIRVLVYRRDAVSGAYAKTEDATHYVHTYLTAGQRLGTLGVTKQGAAFVFVAHSHYPDYPDTSGSTAPVMRIYGSDGTMSNFTIAADTFDYGGDPYRTTQYASGARYYVALDGRCCFWFGTVAFFGFGNYSAGQFVFSDGTAVSPIPTLAGTSGTTIYSPLAYANLVLAFEGTKDHAYIIMLDGSVGRYKMYGSDGTVLDPTVAEYPTADGPLPALPGIVGNASLYGYIERSGKMHAVGTYSNGAITQAFSMDQNVESRTLYPVPSAGGGVLIPRHSNLRRIQQLKAWA